MKDNVYFIDPNLIIKDTDRGLGVFTTKNISSGTVIEHSPYSSCWKSTWQDTPENLRKIVFSHPKNNNNYVIGLGYISIYNHKDDNNAEWITTEQGLLIKSLKNIYAGEEIFINYGDAYWSGGWPKY